MRKAVQVVRSRPLHRRPLPPPLVGAHAFGEFRHHLLLAAGDERAQAHVLLLAITDRHVRMWGKNKRGRPGRFHSVLSPLRARDLLLAIAFHKPILHRLRESCVKANEQVNIAYKYKYS